MTIGALLATAFLLTQDPASKGYEFRVDDAVVHPLIESLDASEGAPMPGDIAYLGKFMIVLEDPGRYRFRTTSEKDGRLLRLGEDGKERVFGALVRLTIEETKEGDKKVFYNPLAKLSDDEIRNLRSVRLEAWPEGIEKALALLDPARVMLVVTNNVSQGGRLPPLPGGLRYLAVDESSSTGIDDYRALSSQKELRYFSAHTMAAEHFDCSALKGATSMRRLELSMTHPINLSALSGFAELRLLDLSWNEEVKDVEWIREMVSLRILTLDKSGIEDLSPISGLKSLRSVSADRTPLRKLPKGPTPAMAALSVMSTRLTTQEVDAFRAVNPACKVKHRWETALREGLAGVTRVRVRSGGTCHRSKKTEKTLF